VLATAVDTGFKATTFLANPDATIYLFEATFAPVTLPGGITHTFLLGESDTRTPHVGSTQWLWNRSTVPEALAFTLGGRTTGGAVPLPSAAGAGIVLPGGLALLRRRHRCQRRLTGDDQCRAPVDRT
jgi:hypothetical protein